MQGRDWAAAQRSVSLQDKPTMDGPGGSPARLLELLSAPLRFPEWFPAEQGVGRKPHQ